MTSNSQPSSKPSSAASSTSNSPTPPSAAPTPTPLVIARSFIKQYYQVLSTSPAHIHRFYKSTSFLSHSFEPSKPAEPQPLTDASFAWATHPADPMTDGSLRLDFASGTMDAHETLQGGILVVVTGDMTLPAKPAVSRKFVQTFVLNNGAPMGKKRQFYVHNDILRFLEPNEENATNSRQDVGISQETGVEDASAPGEQDTGRMVPPEEGEEEEDHAVSSPPLLVEEDAVKLEVIEEDSKGETVVASNQSMDKTQEASEEEGEGDDEEEEGPPEQSSKDRPESSSSSSTQTKEPTNNVVAEEKAEPKKSRKKSKSGRFRKDRNARSSSPTDANGKKSNASSSDNKNNKSKPPGSWASLVAGGAAPSSSSLTPPSPSRPSPAAAAAATTAAKLVEDTTTSDKEAPVPSEKGDKKKAAVQRTPEATLFLKNITEKTKEGDIRALFEPYATKLGKTILEITLHATRGFCFVDFDHRVVVDTILSEAEALRKDKDDGEKDIFYIHGKRLDLGRKVPPAEKGRGGGASSNRFRNRDASPGNGAFQKGQRGGRRRNSPRGGNRSNRQQQNQQTNNEKNANATASK